MAATLADLAREFASFLRSERGGAALARKGVGSLALKLLHAALTLLIAVLLARILGPSQFGEYAFAFAVVAVLAVPVQFGLPVLVVRETAAGRAREDAPAIRGIWRWSLRFVLAGSAVVIVAAAAVLAFGWGQMDSISRWTFLWALPLIPLMALGALHGAALRGLDRVVLGQLPDHVIRLAFFAILVLAIMPAVEGITAPRAMAMHTFAAALALIIAHAFLRRARPAGDAARSVDRERSRRWMLATLPLGFVAAAYVINTRADTVLLGMLARNESVGIYQVAVQGAQAVALGLAAINLVVAPRFAALYERGEKEQLQRVVTLSARAVVILTIPVVLVIVSLGGPIVRWIFGVEYQSAYLPLAILAVGQLANAGFGPLGILMTMTGYERATARALALGAGLNIVLNLILIPPFGIGGAAAATAVSLTAWNLMLWHSSRKLLGIDSLAIKKIQGAGQRR